MKYFLLLITCVFISSCYYDNEESLYPQQAGSCDTSQVTYSKSVVPLLSSNCLGCHSNNVASSSGGNIKLENYADVKARVTDGKLYGSIAHLSGYLPMPKGGNKLDNCKIVIIKKWIDAGAPDN